MFNLGGSFKSAKVQSQATFSADNPFDFQLIQGRNITFLYGTLEVKLTTPGGGSAATGSVEDGIAKLVSNLAINWGGGSGTPIEYHNLQQANLQGQHLTKGALRNDEPTAPAAGNSTTHYVDFVIVPSNNYDDIQDPRYAIPGEAPDVENIKVAGKWESVGILFDTVNDTQIDSAIFKINQQSAWVFAPGGDIKTALGVDENGFVGLPLYNKGVFQINQTTSSLGMDIDLPTDVIIRRIFLLVKNSSDVRSDTVLGDIALQTSANINLLGEVDFVDFQRHKAGEMDMSPYTGALMIDLVQDVRDPNYARSKKGLLLDKSDKLNLKFSTNATGRIDYLFDSVRKVKVF